MNKLSNRFFMNILEESMRYKHEKNQRRITKSSR